MFVRYILNKFGLIVLAFIFPNLTLALCAYALGVGRPPINLDYCVVVILLAFGWRWLGLGVLVAVLLVDALSLLGQILPFMRVGDVFYLLQFTFQASLLHLSLLLGAFILLVLVGVGIFWSGFHVGRLSALLIFNVLVMAHFFYEVEIDPDKQRFYKSSGYSLVESQAVLFMRSRGAMFLSLFEGDGVALTPLQGKSASEPLWLQADSGVGSGRMMLIVAESWGMPRDDRIQEAILAPLKELGLDTLQYGQVSPRGMTIAGELRELCHLYPEHYNLVDVTQGFENCLPNHLKAKGYVTASLHGATGLMYDRIHWYPRAGLDERLFFEDRLWSRRCYSFPGACDVDLFPEVRRYFSKGGKRFLYWLTLNTHGPYDLRDLDHDLFDCSLYGVSVHSESCRNFKLQAQFFDGMARLLSSGHMRGVEFVVVGDHPPVMLDVDEKDRVFQGVVPFIFGRVADK